MKEVLRFIGSFERFECEELDAALRCLEQDVGGITFEVKSPALLPRQLIDHPEGGPFGQITALQLFERASSLERIGDGSCHYRGQTLR